MDTIILLVAGCSNEAAHHWALPLGDKKWVCDPALAIHKIPFSWPQ